MTTEEAIEYLTRCADGLDPDFECAVSMAVSALREKQSGGWISVKDRLPKSYVKVLVHCPMTKMATKIEVDYLESRHFSDEWKHGPVTHWQSLPEPPKEESL